MTNGTFLLGARTGSGIRLLLRRLPFPVTRVLITADLLLGTLIPPWGWWLYRRWTRKLIGWRTYWPIYKRSLQFTWKHILHGQSHTGLWSVAWTSPPMRRTRTEERADHRPRHSCGTCTNCCRTTWLPPEERVACPFLDNNRCTIYGGLYWDYFNCGRYPIGEPELRVYECPRFTFGREIPVLSTTNTGRP